MATSCHKMKKTEGRWRRVKQVAMDLSLHFTWRSQRIVEVFFFFFFGDSTGREDVRMGGVRVWGLTGDDEKEETEVDRRQKDVTYSNKRLRGVIGDLQMDYIW